MKDYASIVNLIRIKCPDGTFREPTPCECVSFSGDRPASWPALRAAERMGYLSDAIHLRRLTSDSVHIITNP